MSTSSAAPLPRSSGGRSLGQYLGPVVGVLVIAVLVWGVGWGAGKPTSLQPDELEGTIRSELRLVGATGASCPTELDAKAGASVRCQVTFLDPYSSQRTTRPYDARYVRTESYGTRGKMIVQAVPAG